MSNTQSYGVSLHVWGDFALFTRPEMKSERVSYDVITPSAARGVLEAIYWKPAIRWEITGIRVLKPIQMTNIRRNEVSHKMSIPSKAIREGAMTTPLGIKIEDSRTQRAAIILRDVSYIIDAKIIILNDKEADGKVLEHPEAKHLDTFKRRARTGKCFHQPYFGCREFPVSFSLVEDEYEAPDTLIKRNQDFGFMLQDLAYTPDPKGKILLPKQSQKYRADAKFFRAEMTDGYITVPPLSNAIA